MKEERKKFEKKQSVCEKKQSTTMCWWKWNEINPKINLKDEIEIKLNVFICYKLMCCFQKLSLRVARGNKLKTINGTVLQMFM